MAALAVSIRAELQRRHAQHLAPAQQKTTRPMTLVMSGTGEHGAGKV
jgi:hypothetical protein